MGIDAADVLSLQCPECRALLRMRSTDAGDEPFACPDCGCALRVARLDDGTDSGLPLLEVAEEPPREEAAGPRNARPKRRRGKPTAGAGDVASHSVETDDEPGRRSAGWWARLAGWRQVSPWAGRLKRPTPAVLTWMVAGLLAIGLLLLYVPAGDEAGAVAVNSGGVPADRTGVGSASSGAVPPVPADSAAGPGAMGDVRQPSGDGREGIAAEPQENGDGQLAVIPPDEVRNPPEAGDVPAGGVRPGEAAQPEADGANEQPADVPAEMAGREPVVAPRPDVPPVDLRVALAIRLQSYRMTEPAAAGVLLRELEELTGVPFRVERREGQTDDWKQRRVLVSMEDVTVGELLQHVAELAGVEVRIDRDTVQLIPPVVRDGEAPEASPLQKTGEGTGTPPEMD